MQRPSIALVTVTSDAYAPGTLALLHSFRKHHPGFHGEIVVICDGLSPDLKMCIEQVSGAVRWLMPSPALYGRLHALLQTVPSLAGRHRRFFSLETFALRDYEAVLFCDSDLLFLAPVDDLFPRTEALLTVQDGPALKGQVRDRITFIPSATEALPPEHALRNTFNAGFMRLGRALLTDDTYARLLEHLAPAHWAGMATAHTDQRVLNLVLEGHQTLLPPAYNFLLLHEDTARRVARKGLHAARVLHFNTPVKPWQIDWTAPPAEWPVPLPAGWSYWLAEAAEVAHGLGVSWFPLGFENHPALRA